MRTGAEAAGCQSAAAYLLDDATGLLKLRRRGVCPLTGSAIRRGRCEARWPIWKPCWDTPWCWTTPRRTRGAARNHAVGGVRPHFHAHHAAGHAVGLRPTGPRLHQRGSQHPRDRRRPRGGRIKARDAAAAGGPLASSTGNSPAPPTGRAGANPTSPLYWTTSKSPAGRRRPNGWVATFTIGPYCPPAS